MGHVKSGYKMGLVPPPPPPPPRRSDLPDDLGFLEPSVRRRINEYLDREVARRLSKKKALTEALKQKQGIGMEGPKIGSVRKIRV